MNIQHRIAFIWLMIALCYLFHSSYHFSQAVFGMDIKIPGATGKVPVSMHLMRFVLEVFSMLLALLTLYIKKKGFILFLFTWAIMLLLLNVFHLGETIYKESDNISQVGLLSFVVVANLFLVLDVRKWKIAET